MPLQKNNTFGAKKRLKRPLDKEKIGFKGYEGQKEKLKCETVLICSKTFIDQMIQGNIQDF